jgi:RNA polymerase sigma-70 factor, ECF subfamily
LAESIPVPVNARDPITKAADYKVPWSSRPFRGFSGSSNVNEVECPIKEKAPVTEQQWLTIYRDTIQALYGYMARRTGGNRELSEDIVQETYLRALENWRHKAAPAAPIAWLKRVAQNILIDYVRHSRWTVPVESRPDIGTADDGSGDRLNSLMLFKAISSLGRKKARIIQAFYYEGMNIEEIAKDVKISERAVEGQLRRARRSLKSLLPDRQSNGGKNE